MADVAWFVAALLAARKGGPKLADVPELSTGEAYAVQAGVADRLGPVGGFKYARRPGAPAILAPIQLADVLRSGAEFDSGGAPVGVELEVGFRLDAAPPPAGAADFEDRLRAAVTPVAVLELVQSRLADPDAATAMQRLADHQINGALVVGGAAADWRGEPFARVTARLEFDGEAVLDGRVTLPFGPAFDCLADLVRMAGDHCGGLQAGHYVITGSLNGLPWLPPGTHISGRIENVGQVAVAVS